MAEDRGSSKSGEVCLRLLHGALASVRQVFQSLVHCHSEHVGSDAWVRLTGVSERCFAMLQGMATSFALPQFLENHGFQSWVLVLFELVSLLEWRIKSAKDQEMLKAVLEGPRLRLFLGRLRISITMHLDLIKPVLEATSLNNTDVTKEEIRGRIDQALKGPNNRGILSVSHLIDDSDGRNWWVECFGANKYAVEWSTFFKALQGHPNPIVQKYINKTGTTDLLMATISPQQRKAVTALQWGNFLFSFGPGIRVALIQMSASLKSPRWFAGALSLDEARIALMPYPPGAFLIRFSERSLCSWAVSFCDESTGQVAHSLIQATSSDAKVSDKFVSGGTEYKSLGDLVKQNNAQLREPIAIIKNSGPARVFRDFMSREETLDMLNGEPVGTFLIRFSSNQEATLVLAYVSESNGVQQSQIFCDPELGFKLGEKCYERLPELLSKNSAILSIPLASALPEGFEDMNAECVVDETLLAQGNPMEPSSHLNYFDASRHSNLSMASSNYLPLGTNRQWGSSSPFETYGPVGATGHGHLGHKSAFDASYFRA
mmetsp:Transcript_16887/g.31058  ORF Transcript_16887/g.31058 Transcript_16887/m.31058 type:complete len:545 (+) Transcript_16887:78-1712(+)